MVSRAGLVLPVVGEVGTNKRPRFLRCLEPDKLDVFNASVASTWWGDTETNRQWEAINGEAKQFHCAVQATVMTHLQAAPPPPMRGP